MCFFARNSALAKIFGLAKILAKFQKNKKIQLAKFFRYAPLF